MISLFAWLRTNVGRLCSLALLGAAVFWTYRVPGFESGIALIGALGPFAVAIFPVPEAGGFAGRAQEHLYHTVVPANDLPSMYETFISVFGQDIAPRESIEQWLQKNDQLIWKVYRCRSPADDDNEELIGFYEIIPITKSAKEKMEANASDGRRLQMYDIEGRFGKPRYFYIASIGALNDSSTAKAGVLTELQKHLSALTKNFSIIVYARPATDAGLRLLRRHQFEKIDSNCTDNNSIWKRQLPKNVSVIR